MPQLVFYFSHYSKVKMEKHRLSDIQRDSHALLGRQSEACILQTRVCEHLLLTRQACTGHVRQVIAGRLSYSHASRVGTSLRTRKSGTTPASRAEAQLGLEGTTLEMTHTCEELLSSTHLPIPQLHIRVVTQPAWRGPVMCEIEGAGDHRPCPIQCKKHPLSIYQGPGSGPGTSVFSKPFPDLVHQSLVEKQAVSVPCHLHFYRGSRGRFGGTMEWLVSNWIFWKISWKREPQAGS